VKHLFRGLWSLEDFETDQEVQSIIKNAIENPQNFVMKPQKEGGGNNFFDDDIPKLLNKMLENPKEAGELKTYLIMERITPPTIPFSALKNGNLDHSKGMAELGIFSYVFTKNTNGTHEVLK
jgi:glutathione synthase